MFSVRLSYLIQNDDSGTSVIHSLFIYPAITVGKNAIKTKPQTTHRFSFSQKRMRTLYPDCFYQIINQPLLYLPWEFMRTRPISPIQKTDGICLPSPGIYEECMPTVHHVKPNNVTTHWPIQLGYFCTLYQQHIFSRHTPAWVHTSRYKRAAGVNERHRICKLRKKTPQKLRQWASKGFRPNIQCGYMPMGSLYTHNTSCQGIHQPCLYLLWEFMRTWCPRRIYTL